MDITELKNLLEKINSGASTPEEANLVVNELLPQIKEINSQMEKLLMAIAREKISSQT
jgi:hypothetical protein